MARRSVPFFSEFESNVMLHYFLDAEDEQNQLSK